MGEHHVIFFSLINFGLMGGLVERRVDEFFSLFPLLWVGQQWEGIVKKI